jgi:hypothetical protein
VLGKSNFKFTLPQVIIFQETKLLKVVLFIYLFSLSMFNAHANQLLLVTKVLSEEIVKRDFDGNEDKRLKPFRLDDSNAFIPRYFSQL